MNLSQGNTFNIKINTQAKKSQLIGLLKMLYIVIKFIKILIGLEPIYYNVANYNINPYLQDLKHIKNSIFS
jgi:hypothetical protein